MEKEVKAAEAKYDKAAEAAQEVHNEVKTCDAKIKEITGSKIKSVQVFYIILHIFVSF